MNAAEIATLRRSLNLSQVEFGQLFGVHAMTVSKWERRILQPTAYQLALMKQFQATSDAKAVPAKEEVRNLLVGAGVVAALLWLLAGTK